MSTTFSNAFAAARKAGKKEFMWNGKSYNTELKETVRPKARGNAIGKADSAGPMPRPKVKSVSADTSKGPSDATNTAKKTSMNKNPASKAAVMKAYGRR